MIRQWRVVCPQCGHGFAPSLRHKVTGVKEVEPPFPTEDYGSHQRRLDEKLNRQAAARVLELERAELDGELKAIHNSLAEARTTIARLQDKERALRKRALEIKTRG